MAFQKVLKNELNGILNRKIEIATDNNLLEGFLISVSDTVVTIVEPSTGYGSVSKVVLLPLSAINFVRRLPSSHQLLADEQQDTN